MYILDSHIFHSFVLQNIKDLVVKEVHGSGGHGMLIGPKATKRNAVQTKTSKAPQ